MTKRLICRPIAFLGATTLLAAAIARFAVGQNQEAGNGNCYASVSCAYCLRGGATTSGTYGCAPTAYRCMLFSSTTTNGTYDTCVYSTNATDDCNFQVNPGGAECTGSVWYCACAATGTDCDYSLCANDCDDGNPNLMNQQWSQNNNCTGAKPPPPPPPPA